MQRRFVIGGGLGEGEVDLLLTDLSDQIMDAPGKLVAYLES